MKHLTMIIIQISLAAAFLSCTGGDTALVTVDTGLRQQSQVSLLDRFISWITFASEVQADTAPGSINYIHLTVTAPDMEPISVDIPKETGKITLEVPAGMQRQFEVRAGYAFVGQGSNIVYGGIAYADLTAGQTTNINIEMGNLPSHLALVVYDYKKISYDESDDNSWDTLTKVEFMESISSEGPYNIIATYFKNSFIYDGEFTEYFISYEASLLKVDYYYKVKAYNKYGWYETNPTPYNL